MKVGKDVVVCGLTLALAMGCSSMARSNAETGIAKALVSDQQEVQLGDQVHQELAKQGVRYVTDPVVTNYVTGVANRVLGVARRDRPNLNWKIFVIDDPKTVNAFAVPGGSLYVYTGLLLAADNEAELAGVWGHEAGHVVRRHSARQLVEAYGLEGVLGMALGKNPGLLTKLAAGIAAKGTMLAHSRADETEADELGASYSAQAGYDPHGILQFFQKLEGLEGHTPGAMKWLSDHPLTRDRVSHLQQYIAQRGLRGSDLGAGRLSPVKARLQSGSASSSTAPPAKQQGAASGGMNQLR